MKKAALFNLLSVLVLGLTGVLIVGYLVILVNPWVSFNPFPPPREGSLALGPTPTPSPTVTPALPPTWTPTPSPSPSPPPSPTPTRTPTLTPSPTPTWPPTPTPTPRVTRAPYPFTCEVEYRMNPYGIPWSGVAGKVQDLDGNPLPGYHVAVECPGFGGAMDRVAGADPRYNLMYESEAARGAVLRPHGLPATGNQGSPVRQISEPRRHVPPGLRRRGGSVGGLGHPLPGLRHVHAELGGVARAVGENGGTLSQRTGGRTGRRDGRPGSTDSGRRAEPAASLPIGSVPHPGARGTSSGRSIPDAFVLSSALLHADPAAPCSAPPTPLPDALRGPSRSCAPGPVPVRLLRGLCWTGTGTGWPDTPSTSGAPDWIRLSSPMPGGTGR